MVSVLPNQVFDQEDFNYNYNHYLETMSLPTATTTMEDSNKKVRKPYTITKSRKNWTDQEHEKFLEAIQLFDRDWKKIEAFVGSKTVIQIRSHAQKYFLKVQKNGKCEHVPPPRPKRKAARPYPQKASKIGTIQSSATMLEPGYNYWPNSSSVLRNPTIITALPSRTYDSVQAVNASHVTKDDGDLAVPAMGYNFCDSSSNESTRTLSTFAGNNQGNQSTQVRVMPDFAQVYRFIGSVFDPSGSDHLQKLKQMDPINVETVLLLMRNLSINLRSPKFYDHRRLLLSYDDDSRKAKASSPYNNFHADKAPPYTAIPSV